MRPITNLRSLGGLLTTDQRVVKAGLIYRSGQLDHLDAEQIDYLTHNLQLKRIVDMRTAAERKQFADVTIPNVHYEVLDILEQATDNGASLQSMVMDHGNVHHRMLELYEQLALSSSARRGYQRFIQELLIPEQQPVLFHCFAGKDRTGIGAALILKILGVADDVIMADYLATNQQRQRANQEILTALKDKLPEPQLRAIQVALLVDADYLQHYFDVITAHYETFAAYLTTGLQLTTAELAKLRQLYLDD